MAGATNQSGSWSAQIRVAIVENDVQLCANLVRLIDGASELNCVATCHSAEEALVGLPARQPDVVLMDIGLPGMSGIECIAKLKELLPACQIMMVTIFEDHDRIFQSLKAGATGYLLKKATGENLVQSIRDLYSGGSPMSNQIARRVVQEFQKTSPRGDVTMELTVREKDVLGKLARGFLYKEVAQALGISLETVRTHTRNIYSKLHVRTRTEALNKVFPNRSGSR